ncbi:MAG: LPS export ABC transporter periplasmic protein LptC [Bacteroidales bacterium]|nr:LPS export ABC transporter periplasmic protein LptC [Bacteroidales bacterium]
MSTSAFRYIYNAASGTKVQLAVVVFLSLAFSSCIHNTQEEIRDVEDMQQMASLAVRDLHTVVTDSGFFKYEFETPELAQYDNAEEPYIDFPQGLKFKMYSEKGTLEKSRIRCNNAKYYKDKNLWELNNDVEAVTQKGEILNTEQLFWDTKEHTIQSDKFVKITTKNQVITGYGFESDEKLSKYEIKHPGGEIEVDND